MADYLFAYERLDVWQIAKDFAVALYKITDGFPREERYGLVSQMNELQYQSPRISLKEVPEQVRKTKRTYYQIAYSSLMEVTSQLSIAKDLSFVNEQEYNTFRTKIYEISNKLNALHKSQLS